VFNGRLLGYWMGVRDIGDENDDGIYWIIGVRS
jgi:hypothetical protein